MHNMTEAEIQTLVTKYNQHRPSRDDPDGRDRGRSWCPQDEFDMLQVIIEDLEPAGFTDFRYDGSKSEYRAFIVCNYGPMICRIDISCADRQYFNRLRIGGSATAELDYLRAWTECGITRWSSVCLCAWGWERSGNPVRTRDLRLDRLLVEK